jgi:hypothetical protein
MSVCKSVCSQHSGDYEPVCFLPAIRIGAKARSIEHAVQGLSKYDRAKLFVFGRIFAKLLLFWRNDYMLLLTTVECI